jgi:ribosomal protein L29
MKAVDLRGKKGKELADLLKKAQEDVEKSVSEVLQGKTKDTSRTKKLRRQVARIKTVLAEKQVIAEMESVKKKENKDAKENI